MKKKIFLVIFCVFFASSAYPFWFGAHKPKKLKNPTQAAVTPALRYQEALNYFEKKQYKKAYKSFKKLLKSYPDMKESAEAQYYLAASLEQIKNPVGAFKEYQKLVDNYPNSRNINEAIERQYRIGESFMKRNPRFLCFAKYDFIDHPSLEIFKTIAEKSPYSAYAAVSQYNIGLILTRLNRNTEALEAFQKVVDNFPDSEWAPQAKYQAAVAASRSFTGTDYDSSGLEDANKQLDDFVRKYPDADITSQASDQLTELREKEAQKTFETAAFYEKKGKYGAARTYYSMVVERYPASSCASSAREKIDNLRGKR